MDSKGYKTIQIPMGNTKEDSSAIRHHTSMFCGLRQTQAPEERGRQSKGICLYARDAPRVDRHWACENDGRRKADRREGAVLHNSDRGIKKERNRQVGSLERSSPNFGRLRTVPLLISARKNTTFSQNKAISPKKTRKNKENIKHNPKLPQSC